MDSTSTTGIPGQHYSGERQASVSSFITSLVLLVGVFGGLLIVITVILVCKYCQAKRKPLTRRQYSGSGRDSLSERTFRALQRYETINSDVFSEPSTCSLDGAPLTPRKPLDFRLPEKVSDPEDVTELTHLKADFDKDEYMDQGEPYTHVLTQTETAAITGSRSSPPRGSQTAGTNVGSGSRRVSFQLDNLPRSSSSGDFKFRRYIEGDFHHLKHSKIGRPLPRQFSMGGASSAIPGRILLDDPHFRFSSLDERLTNVSSSSGIMPEGHRQLRELHQLAQQQHHIPQQQQQQQGRRDARRTSVERGTSPKHSRDTLFSHEQMRSSRDIRESPSPTCRLAKGGMNSTSPTFGHVRDSTSKNSPSPPFRPIRESPPSLSPLASGQATDKESPPSPFRPIQELVTGSSPSPPYKPVRTQVAAEIHHQHHHAHSLDTSTHSGNSSEEQYQRLISRLDRTRSYADSSSSSSSFRTVPLSKTKVQNKALYSHSLETPRPSSYRDSRKVKSYDDFLEDYDVLEITEFSKGPFYNTDYDIISELGSPTGSKVRYNDRGSLEQLNEDSADFACALDYDDVTMVEDRKEQQHSEAEDSADTLNGNRKYRALWRLRATLEEEEECSDTIRMEDMTSPDDSPDREHVTPNTTSFESGAQSDPCPSDHRDSGIQFEGSSKPGNHANFLHPNYENRRQNYRNVLNHRLQKGNQSTSVENSFDSVETDGEVSDTSRYEVTTTSFESSTTTDNTDSTTESQASKLRQMKADSGYKSLETQHQNSKEVGDQETGKWDYRASVECGEGIAARRDSRASVERSEGFCQACGHNGTAAAAAAHISMSSHQREGRTSGNGSGHKNDGLRRSSPTVSHFDRRNGKTASKKRREYSRERQTVQVYESINEPETDSRSDLHSGDSFEDSSIPSKISVFARFFKSHPRGHRSQYLSRDYCIDEKTNSIFNEFVRQEIPASSREPSGRLSIKRSPRMNRHRLQRKHTEPALMSEERATRRDRLAPSMRSVSLGSDSSASSARRISPQDSIEEEEDEIDEAAMFPERVMAWRNARSKSTDVSSIQGQLQAVNIHDIPIIKLPEEEAQDVL